MNELKKEMREYILQEVSVWNKDGNREKFLPQQEYINLCEAISIAEQYIKEAFESGYMSGHNDTVESNYDDPASRAEDYLKTE